jgi:hypothetical protein
MRLAPRSRNREVEARMSRSVQKDCSLSVPVCPTVPSDVLTRETSDREVRIAPLLRGYTLVSLVSSLVDTLVLLPTGTIYRGTAETLFSCQSTIDMLSYQHEKIKNYFPLRGKRQGSYCGYSGILWGTFRCGCYPYCVARASADNSERAGYPTPAPNKERPFIPRLERWGFLARLL